MPRMNLNHILPHYVCGSGVVSEMEKGRLERGKRGKEMQKEKKKMTRWKSFSTPLFELPLRQIGCDSLPKVVRINGSQNNVLKRVKKSGLAEPHDNFCFAQTSTWEEWTSNAHSKSTRPIRMILRCIALLVNRQSDMQGRTAQSRMTIGPAKK